MDESKAEFRTTNLGLAVLIMIQQALRFKYLRSPDWEFVFDDPDGLGPKLEKDYQNEGPEEYAWNWGISPAKIVSRMYNLAGIKEGFDDNPRPTMKIGRA